MLAVMGLITSLPLFVVLPVVLGIHFKGNPFFIQSRPGLNGRIFRIVKFRTMFMADRALSPLGKWLRSSSLDEIPQFWNVLKGEMSIVGPRPLLMEYLPLYTESQHLRHSVKPGITGLAQVNGGNNLSWEEKFAYDLHYVQHRSLALDMHIIATTFLKLLHFTEKSGAKATKFSGKNELC